jgi:Tfp pilus assembly protein PilP
MTTTYHFTLFVAGNDTQAKALAATIELTFAECIDPLQYHLEIIDVIELPEKALEKNVFATPTLLREMPLPVLKLIGDVAQTQKVMALIVASDGTHQSTIV